MTSYEEYMTWDFERLEVEYTKQGFCSLNSFLLAQKNKTAEKTKKSKYRVKVSDINSGCVVGFTHEGCSIVAAKKTTKGAVSIFYSLHDPELHTPHVTKKFPSVKMMVEEINNILDVEKTEELAWW